MYLYDYVIMFALREEFLQFVKAICVYKSEDIDNTKKLSNYYSCYRDYENKNEIDEVLIINNKKFKIYATTQKNPGLVSASICASRLIKEYRPKYIVLLGIAAGFEDREFGSVLIADYVFIYQQGKIVNGEFKPDGTGITLDSGLKQRFVNHKDWIIESVRNVVFNNRKHQELNLNINEIDKIGAFIGPVATSIQVVADKEEEKKIKQTTRKAIGLEMEGFGLFQTVDEYDAYYKPTPILIKSVCDHAGTKKNNDYHALAAFTSAYFFLKYLELEEVKLELDEKTFDKSYAKFIPYNYLTERKREYKEIIKNAPENSEVCFISITAESDLGTPPINEDRGYLTTAFDRGIKFRGIVVNPDGNEAFFRNNIESPGKKLQKTILWKGAERVRESLEDLSADKDIKMRYARVGTQFKLWLSNEAALIEPYHFGREPGKHSGGLCGFSQVLYSKDDKEYCILKDHFEKLWERSDPFWPKEKSYLYGTSATK